jgi:hypothetical protein
MRRPSKVDWNERATALIKREMKETGVSYTELAERLGSSRVTITNKVNRGVFVTAWFLQAMDAMKVKTLRLDG